MNTLLITIVPSILILLYFFLSDRFKEPKGSIALVFFLGILICLPAGIINSFMHDNFNDGTDLSEALYSSFLGPAWSEEILKFIILYFVVLRRNEFNEPMDGIVYGVTVSLGFATYENYDYTAEEKLVAKKFIPSSNLLKGTKNDSKYPPYFQELIEKIEKLENTENKKTIERTIESMKKKTN